MDYENDREMTDQEIIQGLIARDNRVTKTRLLRMIDDRIRALVGSLSMVINQNGEKYERKGVYSAAH